jgi:hypothetical protein
MLNEHCLQIGALDDLGIRRAVAHMQPPSSALDDNSTHKLHRATACNFEQTQLRRVRLHDRKQIVFATLDSTFDLELLAQSLKAVISSNGAPVVLCWRSRAAELHKTSYTCLHCTCLASELDDADGTISPACSERGSLVFAPLALKRGGSFVCIPASALICQGLQRGMGGSTVCVGHMRNRGRNRLDTPPTPACLGTHCRMCDADGALAVGLLTVLTFGEICQELQAEGLNPVDLDFLVCNCGAYIFYMSTDGVWIADETWEAKVSYRWDKKLVVRTPCGHCFFCMRLPPCLATRTQRSRAPAGATCTRGGTPL